MLQISVPQWRLSCGNDQKNDILKKLKIEQPSPFDVMGDLFLPNSMQPALSSVGLMWPLSLLSSRWVYCFVDFVASSVLSDPYLSLPHELHSITVPISPVYHCQLLPLFRRNIDLL